VVVLVATFGVERGVDVVQHRAGLEVVDRGGPHRPPGEGGQRRRPRPLAAGVAEHDGLVVAGQRNTAWKAPPTRRRAEPGK
jgi:hypothetical protein